MSAARTLPTDEATADDGLGLRLGRFELLRLVDIAPDSSRAFLARESESNRYVRLTVHDPRIVTAAFRSHLLDQLQHARSLAHVNLPSIDDVVELGDLLMVSTPWPAVWSLRMVLQEYSKRGGVFPEPLLAAIGLQLQHLLAYLEGARSTAGLPLHGCSGNLGLDSVGVGLDGQVMHLGIPHVALDDVATLRPPPAVTTVLARLAPEQLRSVHPNRRADVYSFGMLLSSLVLGHNPVERPTAAATRDAVREGADLGPLQQWEPSLATALRHAIEPAVDRRDGDIQRLGLALDRARFGHGSALEASDVAELIHELFGVHARPQVPAPVQGDDAFLAVLAEHCDGTAARPPAVAPLSADGDGPTEPATPTAHVATPAEAPRDRRAVLPTVLAASALLVSIVFGALVIMDNDQTVPAEPPAAPVAAAPAAVGAPASSEPSVSEPAASEAAVEAVEVGEVEVEDATPPDDSAAGSTTGPAPDPDVVEAMARAEDARARVEEARAAEAQARAEEAEARAAEAKERARAAALERPAVPVTVAESAPAEPAAAETAPAEPAAAEPAPAETAPAETVAAETVAAETADPGHAGADPDAVAMAEPDPQAGGSASADVAPAAEPAAPAYDHSAGAGLPRRYEARSPADVSKALAAIEAFAIKAGVPPSKARGATGALGAELIASYSPGSSIILYPRASFDWIVDAAAAGQSAAAIRSGLSRAHASGALK